MQCPEEAPIEIRWKPEGERKAIAARISHLRGPVAGRERADNDVPGTGRASADEVQVPKSELRLNRSRRSERRLRSKRAARSVAAVERIATAIVAFAHRTLTPATTAAGYGTPFATRANR